MENACTSPTLTKFGVLTLNRAILRIFVCSPLMAQNFVVIKHSWSLNQPAISLRTKFYLNLKFFLKTEIKSIYGARKCPLPLFPFYICSRSTASVILFGCVLKIIESTWNSVTKSLNDPQMIHHQITSHFTNTQRIAPSNEQLKINANHANYHIAERL